MTQQEALDILKIGHSVYITGEAGTGKTYVLDQYINWLQEHGIEPAVTASTGITATHLQGSTIHSWSGIGVKERITEWDLERMEQKKALWTRLQECRVLVIDEISMLSGDFFDMLDRVLRHMRRAEAPFGGVQLVCSGDFFQLPPVVRGGGAFVYAFESDAWRSTNPIVCYLTEQFRHGGNEFLGMLSAIRHQEVTEQMRNVLVGRNKAVPQRKTGTTRLFTHNKDVDAINQQELAKLKGKEQVFFMQHAGKRNYVESLAKGCLAPEMLTLKKGAEVMFVKNDPGLQYVNGTQGVVTGFHKKGPTVQTRSGRIIQAEPVSWQLEEDGKVLAEITQIPLRLAWAITVHKSQGMTLDEAEMDLSACFVPGQGYVALSRVRSLDGLYLRGFNNMALAVDQRIAKADAGLQKRSQLAKERLSLLSQQDLQKRHKDFLLACGGSLESVGKHGKKSASSADAPMRRKPGKKDTLAETQELLQQGMPLEKIPAARGLTLSTVLGHAEKLLERGVHIDFNYLTPDKELLPVLLEATAKHGFEKLAPVKFYLERKGYDIPYEELRKMRLSLWPQKRK